MQLDLFQDLLHQWIEEPKQDPKAHHWKRSRLLTSAFSAPRVPRPEAERQTLADPSKIFQPLNGFRLAKSSGQRSAYHSPNLVRSMGRPAPCCRQLVSRPLIPPSCKSSRAGYPTRLLDLMASPVTCSAMCHTQRPIAWHSSSLRWRKLLSGLLRAQLRFTNIVVLTHSFHLLFVSPVDCANSSRPQLQPFRSGVQCAHCKVRPKHCAQCDHP